MRTVLLSSLLVPLFIAVPALSQAGDAAVRDDSLYSIALFASLREMSAEWGHIDDSDQGGIRTDYRNARVEARPGITDGLPKEEDGYRVECMDARALIDKYKALGKGFSVLEINPMQNKGADLVVNITVSYFSYKKGRMLFAVSDWSNVTFRYDPEGQRFVISSVKLGGI